MNPSYSVPADGVDRVFAETKRRDAGFQMSGHHCHSCYEIFYVHSGDCRFLVEDHFFDLHEGELIMIPPMVLHYTRYTAVPCIRTVVLFRLEDINKDFFRQVQGKERLFAETSVFRIPSADRIQVNHCLERMAGENGYRDTFSPMFMRIYLHEFLLFARRSCESLSGSPEDIQTRDQQILRAARYINENYMNPITTEDVAQAVNFSPNYLSRRFRQETGIGLHEYIVFVRLNHAAQELVSTSDSITEIALRCGFSGSNYFKDSFKKKYGMTPRSYRNLR